MCSLRDTRSLFRLKRIPLDSSLQIVHGIVLASRYVSAYLTLVENHSANTLFPQQAFTFHTGFDAMVFQRPSRSWLVNWQAFAPSPWNVISSRHLHMCDPLPTMLYMARVEQRGRGGELTGHGLIPVS